MSDKKLTEEALLKSIEPDSTQLNAIDCIACSMTVTIADVREGSTEQPVNIHLVGYDRVYRPCKTSIRVMATLWGSTPSQWIGNSLTLYNDPSVKYGGAAVGGLRISHASGIDTPQEIPVTISRLKRQKVTIQPIKTAKPIPLTEEEQTLIAEYTNDLNKAESMETLKVFGQILGGKSKTIQDAMRPLYRKRKEELTPVTEPQG